MVVSTITALFFAEVVHAIEETARSRKYNVILSNSGGIPERESEAVRALQERRVDGIVLVSACSSREALCADKEIAIPVIMISNVHTQHIGYSVKVDNVGRSRLGSRRLLDLGHRRVAHIAGPARE